MICSSSHRRAKRLSSRHLIVLLGTVLFATALSVHGADAPALQPRLRIVVSDDSGEITKEQSESRRLIFAAVEARFAGQARYLISRTTTDVDPEEFVEDEDVSPYDVVLFLRLNPRLDGTLRFDYDVWRDGAFVRSGDEELPVGEERFSRVDTLADGLTDAVGSLFPGFGRLRFSNTGYQTNYYVEINGIDAGGNIEEIDLPIGTYEVVVRRRDEGFSHVVGRSTIELRVDDFYEIVFALDRQPPPIPGYLRYTDPADRWRGIFTIRSSAVFPMEGFEEQQLSSAWSATGTALFGDFLFRGFLLGFEAGYLQYRAKETIDNEIDLAEIDVDIRVDLTPVMGTLGFTIGPVAGVDIIARGGGGIAIYRTTGTAEYLGVEVAKDSENRYDPVASGTFEIGFGLGKHTRLSIQTAYLAIIQENDRFSWIQIGLGLGGRY